MIDEGASGFATLGDGRAILHGPAAELVRWFDDRFLTMARTDGAVACRFPATIAESTLARAGYFDAFPQGATALGESGRPYWMPPAVCYHVYAALAGRVLTHPVRVTAQGTCWRHEGDALRPLARGWAFTMREGVCLGDADVVAAFRDRGIARARALAAALSLDARLEEATDPFFRPTARGRELLQRLKGLKQELRLPVGDDIVAAASFNLHEGFFGEAFDIRLADGSPAASGCVAYGLERWLLAFLAAHGTSARDWPVIPSVDLPEVAA
jgi:seryl-tRNA synthetase